MFARKWVVLLHRNFLFSVGVKLSSLPGCDAADAGWPDLRRRERLKARTGATADGRFDEFGNKKLDRFRNLKIFVYFKDEQCLVGFSGYLFSCLTLLPFETIDRLSELKVEVGHLQVQVHSSSITRLG